MKLAFSRPTASEEEQELLFHNYRSAGYDGLQLKPGQYGAYIQEPERFTEKWGDLKGVGSALIYAGTLDQKQQEEFRSLFAFAEKIGTERIVFCHGVPRNQVTEEDIRAYAALLSELGKQAREQHGVQLSLHHHYNQPVMYRQDIGLFFDQAKEGNVKLTLDTAHLVKSGIKDIAEIIYTFRDHIDNFHLKDFADGEWKVLGQGVIDFKPIFKAIRDTGYNGWISADEESGGEIIPSMETCYRFIKEGLEHDSSQ